MLVKFKLSRQPQDENVARARKRRNLKTGKRKRITIDNIVVRAWPFSAPSGAAFSLHIWGSDCTHQVNLVGTATTTAVGKVWPLSGLSVFPMMVGL